MRELFQIWRNTRMIVLTAISAAAYVAVLIPFKGFVIIPGLTEVRPGAAIPIVLSFLFGPAAAWGAGFGNVIADTFGGMLGPGSLFGFLGNFLYGYLPYALWRALMGHTDPTRSGARGWLTYVLILVVSCLVIGAVIGWGADLLRLAPFAALGLIIAVNNLMASAAISTVLLTLLFARVSSWGLLYYQIMDDEPIEFQQGFPDLGMQHSPAATGPAGRRGKTAYVGAIICMIGAAAAFLTGLYISGQALQAGYGSAAFASGSAGSFAVGVGMLPGLLLLLIGAALL